LPPSSILLRECTGSINNVTVWGHYNATSSYLADVSGVDVSNSIIWGQGSPAPEVIASADRVSFTNVRAGTIVGGVGNFSEPPRFAGGPGGSWYLEQVVTGHPEDSPCVDAGGSPATDLGLDASTTRIDEGRDTGVVDLGYHWPVPGVPRSVTVKLSHGASGTRLSYFPYAGYAYDLIRGRLSELAESGSVIDIGSVDCIASDDATGDVLDETPPSSPGPEEAYFYLIREATTPTPHGFSSSGKERVPSVGGCD